MFPEIRYPTDQKGTITGTSDNKSVLSLKYQVGEFNEINPFVLICEPKEAIQ